MQQAPANTIATTLSMGLGLLAAVGFTVAFFELIDRNSNVQLHGFLVGVVSCVPCGAAILLSVWGKPAGRAAGLLLKRALAAAALVVGLGVLSTWINEGASMARNAKNDAVAADRYTNAKAYKHHAATFDPATQRVTALGCDAMSNECPGVVIVPFKDDGFLLVLSHNERAHTFDGNTSVMVDVVLTPTHPNHTVHEGHFTFRGQTFRLEGMHGADIEYLRPVGSEAPYVNGALLEKVAPLK